MHKALYEHSTICDSRTNLNYIITKYETTFSLALTVDIQFGSGCFATSNGSVLANIMSIHITDSQCMDFSCSTDLVLSFNIGYWLISLLPVNLQHQYFFLSKLNLNLNVYSNTVNSD